MPALALPCTSGVETSKHMQATCWHCGCWDHYQCVDNQYLSPYRTGGKWLPWFLRKSRLFISKYRPLGHTYFNIWGIFTIVGIFLIKWYNIPLTLNCIRGGGFHGTQHLVFRLSHFNAAIFWADNFCNCLNSSCASFGEKKIEVRRVVFSLISIN